MSVRGGDIRQLTINGREFDVAPEASVNLDAGGFQNDGGLNGNGTVHITQRRKLAGFDSCPVSINDSRGDLVFLQELANTGNVVPVTLTLASGVTFSGSLAMWGELMKNTGEGTATIEMRGSKLEVI